MRTVYFLAMAALAGMLIWGQVAAKGWQQVAEDAQRATIEAAKRTQACFEQLGTASSEREREEEEE